MTARTALLSLAFCAMPVLADDIYVGSSIGEVYRYGAAGTSLVFPTMCTSIDSMASIGRTLYIADGFANVFRVQTSKGNTWDMLLLPGAANSMVAHGGALLTGSRDGKIRRINPQTGAAIWTQQVQSTLEAIVVTGDTFYAAGHNTLIYKGNANTGAVTMFSACFGQVNSLAIHGSELLAGGLDGRVYRFNAATGQYAGNYQMATTEHPALAVDAGGMWVAATNGFIHKVNPATGAAIGSAPMCPEISAMSVLPACIADFNGDSSLTVLDFGAFMNAFSAAEPRADVDASGALNIRDFSFFMNSFAAGCP